MNTPIDSIESNEKPLYNFSTPIKGITLYYADGTKKDMDIELLNFTTLPYLLSYNPNIKGFIIK